MGLKVTEFNWLDLRLFIVQYSGQPEDGSAALSFNSNGTSLLIKSSVDATALILCTCGYERRVNTHTLLPRDPNIYAVRNKKYLNDKVISTWLWLLRWYLELATIYLIVLTPIYNLNTI